MRNRLGEPVAERFTVDRRVDDDEHVITVRDNLTGEEREWGDFLEVPAAIERWKRRQKERKDVA